MIFDSNPAAVASFIIALKHNVEPVTCAPDPGGSPVFSRLLDDKSCEVECDSLDPIIVELKQYLGPGINHIACVPDFKMNAIVQGVNRGRARVTVSRMRGRETQQCKQREAQGYD